MSETLDQISKLGRWGLVSVMLALVFLASYSVYVSSQTAARCSQTSTEIHVAIVENTRVMQLLADRIESLKYLSFKQ